MESLHEGPAERPGGIRLKDGDRRERRRGTEPNSVPVSSVLSHPEEKKAEVMDSVDLGGKAGCIHLIEAGGELLNLWLTGLDGLPVSGMERSAMESMFHAQLDLLSSGAVIEAGEGRRIRYQTFTERDPMGIAEAHGKFDLLRENGNHVIRKSAGDRTYQMDLVRNARKRPVGSYMLSRLSTRGSRDVPGMVGMSYWDLPDGNAPWMRLTDHPSGSAPSFRSFLSALKGICDEFVKLSGDRSKSFLLDLSRKEHPSFGEARRIGEALGRVHGGLLIEGSQIFSERSDDQISDLFRPSAFSMTDVGTTIGTGSFYLTELKREFVRLLGDRPKVNPVTGRRLKPLKRHPEKSRIEGIDWSAMDIFRSHFRKVERRLRSGLGLIREFRSSPTLPSGMDCRLERIQVGPRGNHIFNGFDFEFYGVEEGKLDRFLPLKDLAMVLNSFTKARYLTARMLFRSMGPRTETSPMTYLFLDYNLSKATYREMMKDYNVLRVFQGKEMPFGFVHKISLVSALWFERARNFLVEGYVNTLTDLGHEDLLSYPKGVDTIEGMDLIRSLVGLSSTLRAVKRGSVSSSAGLESDLLCALYVGPHA